MSAAIKAQDFCYSYSSRDKNHFVLPIPCWVAKKKCCTIFFITQSLYQCVMSTKCIADIAFTVYRGDCSIDSKYNFFNNSQNLLNKFPKHGGLQPPQPLSSAPWVCLGYGIMKSQALSPSPWSICWPPYAYSLQNTRLVVFGMNLYEKQFIHWILWSVWRLTKYIYTTDIPVTFFLWIQMCECVCTCTYVVSSNSYKKVNFSIQIPKGIWNMYSYSPKTLRYGLSWAKENSIMKTRYWKLNTENAIVGSFIRLLSKYLGASKWINEVLVIKNSSNENGWLRAKLKIC